MEGLPLSDHKSTILMVVNRLTKFDHTAKDIATIFFAQIHKLHGLPSTIVSDRDPIFVSTFWSQLFKLLGIKLVHTSAYHPQSDGQTKSLNQCLENYLRCMTFDRPKQ